MGPTCIISLHAYLSPRVWTANLHQHADHQGAAHAASSLVPHDPLHLFLVERKEFDS